MKSFEFINTVKIIGGDNSLEKLPYELAYFKVRKPLLLSDEGIKSSGILDKLLKQLAKSNISVQVFTDIPRDSSTFTVRSISEKYRQSGCDCIIAVGGGSVIDTAKGAKLLLCQGKEDLKAVLGNEVAVKGSTVPFFVIPTTCGTGSECTSVAVIKDETSNIKLEFITPQLLPDVAILDGTLLAKLPPKMIASTAIDALSHALESYTGLQKNPISDGFAIGAIKMIGNNIEKALEGDGKSITELLLASNLAGISFSNSMVSLIHALAHALGGVCGIPHGIAVGITLAAGLKFNFKNSVESLSEVLFFLDPASEFKSPDERAYDAIENIRKLVQKAFGKVGISLHLRDYIKDESILNSIAKAAYADGAILVNTVRVNEEDLLNLLKELY